MQPGDSFDGDPPPQRLYPAPLDIELVMRPVSISDLPPETLEQILSPLPPEDILKMKEVPSDWQL